MTFDPLHKWLGIPASEQPPNHYRLLGIPVFEDDSEVIDAAADKQLAFLHDLTNGPHAEAAEDLSNRVSAARVCLHSQAKKAAYDAKLRPKTSRVRTTVSAGSAQGAASVARAAQGTYTPTSTPRNQEPTSGWMLIHGDGIEHGPYPFESLVDAAGRGRITPSTMVRHPVITGDQWQQALSVKGLADACPASMAVATTANVNPASASPSTMVATALRPEPARVSVKTRRKSTRSNRSWIATVVGSALPAVMLIGLVVTIQRNDPLRLALVNLLSPGAVPEEVEQVIGPRPQTTPQASPTRAVPEPTPPPEPTPSTVEVQPRQLPIPDIGPQTDPSPQPVSLDEKHPIRLDLSDPTWSAVLEGARRDDQFFVEGVEKVSARLHMEPLSGELSFDRPTLVTFTSLSGPNGLGMELTLIESKDDLAEISVKGRVVSDGQEFREINLRKRRKDLNESLANTNAVVNRYTLRRAEGASHRKRER